MKITTFSNINTSKNNSNTFSFHKHTDYSKMLDNIIANNIIDTNPYLYDIMADKIAEKKYNINFSSLKDDDNFAIAAAYIASFSNKLPYTLGHTYYFHGIPIIFHLDSIEIDGEEYFYDEFNDLTDLILPKKAKNTIIDIYTKGNTKIDIYIKK